MRINGKILIAIVGFVIVAAAGVLGLGKLGGFALIKEFYPGNAAHQVTAAAPRHGGARTKPRRRMLPKTCRS